MPRLTPEQRQELEADLHKVADGEELTAPDSAEPEPQVSEPDAEAQADLEAAMPAPQEEPEPTEPQEPAEEPTPPAEAEEASQEGEPQPEGEEEPPFYDIPDDGQFVLTIDGEEKVYSGEAVKKMAMQGRLSGQKNVELKSQREQFDREKAEWEATRAHQRKADLVEELLRIGAMREVGPGKVEWIPELDPKRRQEAIETAERAVGAGESREEFKLPRISREALGDDADLVPDQMIDTFNEAMEKAELAVSAERERGDKLEAGFERRQQEDFEQEQTRIFRELHGEITKQLGVEKGSTRYRMAFEEALHRLERGYDGEYDAMVAEIAAEFGTSANPKPTNDNPPTAERKKVLQPPPRRRAAPPAVGSTGRRAPPAKGQKTLEDSYDEHGFGNMDSKAKIAELIREELGT